MTSKMPLLSAHKQEIAEKGAEDLFYYGVAAEKHAAVLRKNLEELPAVYADYRTKYQPGTELLPPPEKWDAAVDHAKKAVDRRCHTLTDHLLASCSAMFLIQAISKELREQGQDIYSVASILKTEKENAFYSVKSEKLVPSTANNQSTSPSFASEAYRTRVIGPTTPCAQPGPDIQFPLAHQVTKVFTWNDICQHDPPILVTNAQTNNWRSHPEPVQQYIFIGDADSETRAFKVAFFVTIGKDRIFYVQFVGDDEALGFTTDDFFELLDGAQIAFENPI
ncbi:hypothetical protein DL96DRAFT_1585783 [Flagelloscypha sp. PMI_526]|nr:hypothetical protein DL96DRAFT_1585783 [Flagelloscypha sp. PMI_526]